MKIQGQAHEKAGGLQSLRDVDLGLPVDPRLAKFGTPQ